MTSQGKILVVDDDATIRTLLSKTLTRKGYAVETAANGQEGLAQVLRFDPDLIILDILMPVMDGYTFVLEFKKIGDLKQTPIIVLTTRDSMREIFAMEGINDYIVKPFSMERLLIKIARRFDSKIKTILVIDDEPEMVEIIQERLKKSSYDVLTATNGLEGFELARTENPDLIIADIMMPKLDGYRLCRMLKFDEKYKHISVVLLTALSRESDRKLGLDVGADAYLVKPYDGNLLLKTVKELLWD